MLEQLEYRESGSFADVFCVDMVRLPAHGDSKTSNDLYDCLALY